MQLAEGATRPSDPVKAFRYGLFVVGRSQFDLLLLDDDAQTIDRAIADYRAHVWTDFDPSGKDVEKRAQGIMPKALNIQIVVGERPSDEEIQATMVARKASRVAESILVPALGAARVSSGRISICPDGDLWRLSFEALPWRDGAVIDAFDVRYLTSSWDLLVDDPAHAATAPLVVAAPDFGPCLDEGHYEDLPGTAKEGRIVAELLDVEPITGKAATRARVLRDANHRLIHFATHSFYDDQQVHAPRELVERFGASTLTPPSRDSEAVGIVLAGINRELARSDGDPVASMLTVKDVQAWDLRGTRLVVLASCESGIGEVQPGDASRNLAQAFLAAGAANVVAALWPVGDQETLMLMALMYRELLAGKSVVDALRKAKLAVREKYPEARHWGAFYLLGIGGPYLDAGAAP